MVSLVYSSGIQGIDGYLVEVEGNVSLGLPTFEIVGLPDAAVKESKERVRSAITALGFEFPLRRVIMNLAPGHIRKEGPGFDLPIALAILTACESISVPDIKEYLFLGELSLSGELRPIHGILPMVMAARQRGIRKVILPEQNAREAAVVQEVEVYGAKSLHQVLAHITGTKRMQRCQVNLDELFSVPQEQGMDFAEVKGQQVVKRGLEIAAAGGHNCLMIGTPGSGKTMLAQRIPTILPDLTFEEALEITKIHSAAGLMTMETPLVTKRPFRSPHHSVSTVSLVGGGRIPKPGEVSLAHNGVLFLDEMPEFRKDALEILRQPLEDRKVTISRVNASITYPSNFMLIAAMNPCKCGYFGDPTHNCTCSMAQIHQYMHRISGPLLDRIDLHIEVAPVEYAHLAQTKPEETSASIKKRVNRARALQRARYQNEGIYCNAELSSAQLDRYCTLGTTEKKLLETAFQRLGLSARAYSRIIKVARTIADLDGVQEIDVTHLAEAIQYRSLDREGYGM